MSADGWDLTDLGRQSSGETYDVRYDPASGTVTVNGAGMAPESFEVDPSDWQRQATRELAARGYGARWTQWDDAAGGASVMSAARVDAPAPAAGGDGQGDGDPGWEGAASYSAAAAEAPEPPPRPEPRELGRVRVYPTYTFPVYQSGEGGIGLDQEITITDWDKQGRDWAEAEARRQVAEALGGPPHDESVQGGAWWMGRPVKDAFRWQPEKGTPRSAKPFDGMPEPPPWQPERPEPAAGTGPETAETGPAGAGTDPAAGETRTGPDGETITPEERARLIAEAAAAGTPFVLTPADVQPGDQVLDGEELARVTEVDASGVVIDHGQERTPGVPGSRYSRVLDSALEGGMLRKVPADATYASLEERRPPAEQAERYAERRAHYEEHHGPGKRGKKGWTAHKRGCRVCQDIDAGGDGVGRRLQVVREPAETPAVAETPAPAPSGGGSSYTGERFTLAPDDGSEIRHWRFEHALDTLQDQVGGWQIPDDGTGVLEVDSFIASIGGYVNGLAGVLAQLGEQFGSGETPIAPVVGETLTDFASALDVMAGEAAEVYQRWTDNEDNAHDLRRARGEVPGAHLFNVSPAA
jgi:hypothetical protein